MKRLLFTAGLGLLAAFTGRAADEPEPPVDLVVKPNELQLWPSFETCSFYFVPTGAREPGYQVEFRRVGTEAWQRTFAPVCDKPATIWKGSIFGLAEDTSFQVRVLSGNGQRELLHGDFHTWSSHPPIGRTVDLSTLDPAPKEGLVISDQGTDGGWIRYTAPAGWILRRAADPDDPSKAAITFRHASHVILDNVTIVGGSHYAVMVDESESVRIENCDLSGWGRVGTQQFTNTGMRGKSLDSKGDLINLDGGVEVNRSARTVIERCYIHDPRGRANSWMFSHPSGPCGLHINYARGGTVVRWNDIVGSDEHRWNDVIETTSNSSIVGGFYRDSDITGNFLAFGEDDGIEMEGGGMNVRFYRNKVEGTTCGVSTGACILGPQFVIGNLVANPGDESGLSLMLFKNSHGVEQGGRRVFINNTLYGPDCAAYGNYGKPAPGAHIGYMRNNIFLCNDTRIPAGESARLDDFDHDLFWANDSASLSQRFVAGWHNNGQEAHALVAAPQFVDPAHGDFHLAATSPARRVAAGIANITPAGEDAGAFFDGIDEVPDRPLALHATPRELDFTDPASLARTEVTVSLAASAPVPVRFTVRQNRVFTWFHVTPDSGELQPGESRRLSVTVDAASLKGRPRFKGAFLVRTADGLSRPVTVYARGEFTEDLRPSAGGHAVYLDAAAMAGAEVPVHPADETGVVGRKFIEIGGAQGSPTLHADFELPVAGHYSLLGRMAMDGDRKNRRAFDVTLDHGHAEGETVDVTDDYQWNIADKRFRVVYLHSLGELDAGKHTLTLKATNGETKLNELIVTDHPEVYFAQYWQRDQTR